MPCPTCSHTVALIAHEAAPTRYFFLCPRCGTVIVKCPTSDDTLETYVPTLVEKCREFERDPLLPLLAVSGEVGALWRRLGINDSICHRDPSGAFHEGD